MKSIKEWSTQYNSFNSLKVLAWREQLEQMARGGFPPPVSVTVDPTNLCNVNCVWCIWGKFRKRKPVSIPDNVLLEMPQFLKQWGVKSVCIAGGGEPLVHPRITDFISELDNSALSAGLITNGLALKGDELRRIVAGTLRWIGISIDAATSKTYQKIKRPISYKAFDKVLENVKWICEHRREERRPQIGAKFLIHDFNYKEIYQFVGMMKDLGVDDVHFRPVYIPHYHFTDRVTEEASMFLNKARDDFEDENFKVFGILHKFDETWVRAIRFKKCRATPIAGFFLADGTFATCCDRRDDPRMNLGEYYPFPQFLKKWGGEEHKKIVEGINPKYCPRCTQAITNEVIEKVIIEDRMTLEFV